MATFRRVQRDDVVALFQRCYAGANIDHDSRTFVAEDCRKQALRIRTGERVVVGMTDARGFDFHQHFARLRPLQIDFFNC